MRILFIVLLLDISALGVLTPMLPFIALDLGAGPQHVAWLVAAFPEEEEIKPLFSPDGPTVRR